MKNLICLLFIIPFVTSCDPTSLMDANAKNATSQTLSLIFVSSTSVAYTDTFTIDPNQTVLVLEGMSTTGGFQEPSFAEYDFIYVESKSGDVLKVYKESTEGKSLYNVTSWELTKPSKRYYQYDYQITDEDLKQ